MQIDTQPAATEVAPSGGLQPQTVTRLFMFEHLGENADTHKSPVAEWSGQADLSAEIQCCLNWDNDMLVPVRRFVVFAVTLPAWMDSNEFCESGLQISYKWFIAFCGNPEWGRDWFLSLSSLSEQGRFAAIKLLKAETKSGFRKSLKEQLVTWLNTPVDERSYSSPFSRGQWERLLDRWTVREARRISNETYYANRSGFTGFAVRALTVDEAEAALSPGYVAKGLLAS